MCIIEFTWTAVGGAGDRIQPFRKVTEPAGDIVEPIGNHFKAVPERVQSNAASVQSRGELNQGGVSLAEFESISRSCPGNIRCLGDGDVRIGDMIRDGFID